jgi:release factor H-coupled RctB family protein
MGDCLPVDGCTPIHVSYASKNRIEGAAVRRLETAAAMRGLGVVAAAPDLRPGKYGPIRCAALADTLLIEEAVEAYKPQIPLVGREGLEPPTRPL